MLRSVPLTPAILGRFEDAAKLDLEWMTESGLASFVDVAASMPALNTIKFTITIEIFGEGLPRTITIRRSAKQ